MQRAASADASRRGSRVASASIQRILGAPVTRARSSSPREKSTAKDVCPREARIAECLPFPQPTSRTLLPAGSESTNATTCVHGSFREAAKESAIRSYVPRISPFVGTRSLGRGSARAMPASILERRPLEAVDDSSPDFLRIGKVADEPTPVEIQHVGSFHSSVAHGTCPYADFERPVLRAAQELLPSAELPALRNGLPADLDDVEREIDRRRVAEGRPHAEPVHAGLQEDGDRRLI